MGEASDFRRRMRALEQPTFGQTEDAFQQAVIDTARLHGWRVAHFRPAAGKGGSWRTHVSGDGAGFPDLVLVHPRHGILYRELKLDGGRVSEDQVAWLAALVDAGAWAAVWRPSDWPQIEATLKGGER